MSVTELADLASERWPVSPRLRQLVDSIQNIGIYSADRNDSRQRRARMPGDAGSGSTPQRMAPVCITIGMTRTPVSADIFHSLDTRRLRTLEIRACHWESEQEHQAQILQIRAMLIIVSTFIIELDLDIPIDIVPAWSHGETVQFPYLERIKFCEPPAAVDAMGLYASILANAPRLIHMDCSAEELPSLLLSLVPLLEVCGPQLTSLTILVLDEYNTTSEWHFEDSARFVKTLPNLTKLSFCARAFAESGGPLSYLKPLSSLLQLEIDWPYGDAGPDTGIEQCLADDAWIPTLQILRVSRQLERGPHQKQIRQHCHRRGIDLQEVGPYT